MTLTEPWYRLGYVTPHPLVDNVPYQFYRIARSNFPVARTSLRMRGEVADHGKGAQTPPNEELS